MLLNAFASKALPCTLAACALRSRYPGARVAVRPYGARLRSRVVPRVVVGGPEG